LGIEWITIAVNEFGEINRLGVLDGLRASGAIQNGAISLRKLGDQYNRTKGTDLHDLGQYGKAVNMAARWEGAGAGSKPLPESLLSPTRLARTLATGAGLRSQLARRVQRKLED